jgi:hypothetical protein
VESPEAASSANVPGAARPSDADVRHLNLVSTSLLFAFWFEVVPLEGDLLTMAMYAGSFPGVVAIKLTCVSLILYPLVRFVRLNGWRALRHACIRVSLIVAIVAVHLSWTIYLLVVSCATARAGV